MENGVRATYTLASGADTRGSGARCALSFCRAWRGILRQGQWVARGPRDRDSPAPYLCAHGHVLSLLLPLPLLLLRQRLVRPSTTPSSHSNCAPFPIVGLFIFWSFGLWAVVTVGLLILAAACATSFWSLPWAREHGAEAFDWLLCAARLGRSRQIVRPEPGELGVCQWAEYGMNACACTLAASDWVREPRDLGLTRW